jgi:hypothetical protein
MPLRRGIAVRLQRPGPGVCGRWRGRGSRLIAAAGVMCKAALGGSCRGLQREALQGRRLVCDAASGR